ncbi:phosphoglucomutase/phosphomannomutase domain-containing protein [Xylariaceae sp. FL0594]|nr:phosphoglucomutase/phosphomannomutase domain-containing protein [Xylariaceae sp. FL0594]
MDRDEIIAASRKHNIVPGHKYQYGTAGFRMKADLLDGVAFRVGLLAALRSRKLNGQTIGIMITASHNPHEDNGVKIVDPLGDMLEQEWEAYATNLVNAPSHEELAEYFFRLADTLKIDLHVKGSVVVGRDTRPSGRTLVESLADALAATKTGSTTADPSKSGRVDFGILTTPQLHYLTRCINTAGTPGAYGEVSELGYYKKLVEAFYRALQGRRISGGLTVDCANGVGGPKLTELLKHHDSQKTGFQVKVVNDDVLDPKMLNKECGADFVKTRQRAPANCKAAPGERWCSLDGDADRLIYYWFDRKTGFFMLDGDRIATLAASFIADLSRSAGLEDQLRIGVIQTAYANGASTKYIEQHLRLPVVCTPTGVKHLHHAACSFDIGVYFEANGHGTVLFSSTAIQTFKTKKPQSPAQRDALDTLSALADLINQTVGDAISDMLLVEVILAHKGWTMEDWALTYQDLPNRLVAIEVCSKDVFRTTDAERKLSHPVGCQEEIDKEVKKYTNARSFARASGTENACRVYAEAATQSEANELANKIALIVRHYGGH